jgi:hypothetical protein
VTCEPTLDHPNGQKSSVGDPDSHKNKDVAKMGHPRFFLGLAKSKYKNNRRSFDCNWRKKRANLRSG